ncbi:hypothetical protein WA577_005982 [Blastocystis sp. JDR]
MSGNPLEHDSVLSELLSVAKTLKVQEKKETKREMLPVVENTQPKKKGRWDDDSDSEEEKRKKIAKKERKQQAKAAKEVKVEAPLVTVAMPDSSYVVDDYYAAHPLMELPPEEEPMVDITAPAPPKPFKESIHMCRSVNKYKKLERLNEGSYGIVYKAQNMETGEIVALKRIKFNDAVMVQEAFPVTALREINILQDLHHPNILHVQEMVVGDSLGEVYMVMDYEPKELGKSLHSIPYDLTASEVKTLLYQLLSGIAYLHRHWYFHRDLKSSNLLYRDGVLKICDFGMARRYSNPLTKYTQHVVTLLYRAPELLLNPQEDARFPPNRIVMYDNKVDMWGVGCLFYEFITRETLITCNQGDNESSVLVKLFRVLGYPGDDFYLFKDSPYASSFSNCNQYYPRLREMIPAAPFVGVRYLSNNGMDLLLRLLEFDPVKRISAEEALDHPYFKELPAMKKPEEMPRLEKDEVRY